jgi:hypothetical protein
MNPAESAKFTVDLTKRQLEQLDAKIARQMERVTEFQREDNAALLSEDQKTLKKMQGMRTRLCTRLAAAQQQLSQVPVDERSLEEIERNCPIGLLDKAGFRLARVVPTESAVSIVAAFPA